MTAGYIEAWGIGIQKIIDGFVNAGQPEPIFEELAGGLQVTLFKSTAEKFEEKFEEKFVEKVVEILSDKQKSILELINRNPHISARELAPLVGISQRKIQENIAKLKEQGIIKRIGPAKRGHWEIQQK